MKFACLAVVAVATLIAMPAEAADRRASSTPDAVMHVGVDGKNAAQVAREIKAAAVAVCRGEAEACIRIARQDANRQYAALRVSRDEADTAAVQMLRDDSASIRVNLVGRSPAQVEADIKIAAKMVCEAVRAGESRGCLGNATRSAKTQLQVALAARGKQLAAR